MDIAWRWTVASVALLALFSPLFLYAQTNEQVEERVRAAFPGLDVMAEIARCESRFRQYAEDGEALHGGSGNAMIGVFQINGPVHADFAASLGMNVYTLEGNLAYAEYLYEKEGTVPWLPSSHCWESAVSASGNEAPLVSMLRMGAIGPQVLTLQKMLNAAGFSVASDGPGSPGEETSIFGSLTRAAVQKFQCEKIAVCDGNESSTGYGLVGHRTRAALLGTSADTTATAHAPDEAAEIARLQAQIAELIAQLAALKQKLALGELN